jgi:hypothetical protein
MQGGRQNGATLQSDAAGRGTSGMPPGFPADVRRLPETAEAFEITHGRATHGPGTRKSQDGGGGH